jgi:hypothetical protein
MAYNSEAPRPDGLHTTDDMLNDTAANMPF